MKVSEIKLSDEQITHAIQKIFMDYAYLERTINRVRKQNRGLDNRDSLHLVHVQHGLDTAIDALGLRENLNEYLNEVM